VVFGIAIFIGVTTLVYMLKVRHFELKHLLLVVLVIIYSATNIGVVDTSLPRNLYASNEAIQSFSGVYIHWVICWIYLTASLEFRFLFDPKCLQHEHPID